MPRLLDTDLRTRDLVHATIRVLGRQGVPGLTLRGIARESGISTGSLLHHDESLARVLNVAAHQTGRLLLDMVADEMFGTGVETFLPVDPDDVALTRAWLGWCELWRGEARLADIVDRVRVKKRTLLAERLDHRLTRPDLDVMTALVEGLRHAICAPVGNLESRYARDLLTGAAEAALARAEVLPPAEPARR